MNNLLPLLLIGSLAAGCGPCGAQGCGWCPGGDFRGGCFYTRGCDGLMRRCCTRCAPACGCGCGGPGCGGPGWGGPGWGGPGWNGCWGGSCGCGRAFW